MLQLLRRSGMMSKSIRHSTSSASNLIIITELPGNVIHIELNRPEKLNSLHYEMFQAIAETAVKISSDKSVRCVILSGKGKAFCSGLDVATMATSPLQGSKLLVKPAGTRITNLAQDVGYLWRKVPCPIIACLHGICFGGGLQIALGADFRIATPDCKISIMEAKWGLIPDMSAAVTLRELVRIDIAKELTMTGRIISGEEALKIGLITKTHQDPYQAALELASEIVKRSPDAVTATKKLFNDSWYSSEEDALNLETSLQKQLLGSYNQLAASGRNTGINMPYKNRSVDI